MIKKKTIKKIVAKEFNAKIGNKAIDKIDFMVSRLIRNILEKASRNAMFAGRKVINEEDLVE